MKSFRKLGFENNEVDEIVFALNVLLANYQIHYQKLRNFHWNVEGPDFFDVHEQFEMEYDTVKLRIDEIAERIRVFDRRPISTLKRYLEVAEIEESHEENVSAQTMVGEILSDMETIISFLVEAHEKATEHGDIATQDMMNTYLQHTEKRYWMLNAFHKTEDEQPVTS